MPSVDWLHPQQRARRLILLVLYSSLSQSNLARDLVGDSVGGTASSRFMLYGYGGSPDVASTHTGSTPQKGTLVSASTHACAHAFEDMNAPYKAAVRMCLHEERNRYHCYVL